MIIILYGLESIIFKIEYDFPHIPETTETDYQVWRSEFIVGTMSFIIVVLIQTSSVRGLFELRMCDLSYIP